MLSAMAKKNPVSEYLANIGRRGGQARVPKGTAALSPEERKALGKKAAEARWGKKAREATTGKAERKTR